MKRPRHPLRNRLEWLLAWMLAGPLLILPRGLSRGALALLGDLAWVLSWGRRRRTIELVQARLGCDRRRAGQIVRGAFRTLTINALEGYNTRRMIDAGRLDEILTVEGAEHLQALLDAGEGVVLSTGHLGSWEAYGPVMAERFQPVFAVGRPLENPLIENLVRLTRSDSLAGQFPKDGAALPVARQLRRGGVAVLLLDQNAGKSSFLMEFMGAPTRQHKIAGVLATRFGVAVCPAYLLREGRGRLRLIIEPVLRPDPELEGEPAALELIERVNASLEAQVRAHPEQWLWLHDRWRSATNNARLAAIQAAKAAKLSAASGADGTTGA